MNTGAEHFIAGRKTPADWRTLRDRLLRSEADAWQEAITDYFAARLRFRYLDPISVLQAHGLSEGEGFSIVTIQCSLIEFLESTAQGMNYRYLMRGKVPGPNEYSSSQGVFVSFLQKRSPFARTFDERSARDFYVNVRCGLLHEARTKNGWRIWADGPTGVVANTKDRVVYRNNFQAALLEYINSYGASLLTDDALQEGFIRKFDDLCV